MRYRSLSNPRTPLLKTKTVLCPYEYNSRTPNFDVKLIILTIRRQPATFEQYLMRNCKSVLSLPSTGKTLQSNACSRQCWFYRARNGLWINDFFSQILTPTITGFVPVCLSSRGQLRSTTSIGVACSSGDILVWHDGSFIRTGSSTSIWSPHRYDTTDTSAKDTARDEMNFSVIAVTVR
jgi:hypothetical protein